MAAPLRTELALDTLTMAIHRRTRVAGPIHHSGHGCQDTSLDFGCPLHEADLRSARGTVGDCFDNAVAERGRPWDRVALTVELARGQVWPTRAAARLAILPFIAVWSNHPCRHSTPGDATPAEYEALAREVAIAEQRSVQEAGSSPTRKLGRLGCGESGRLSGTRPTPISRVSATWAAHDRPRFGLVRLAAKTHLPRPGLRQAPLPGCLASTDVPVRAARGARCSRHEPGWLPRDPRRPKPHLSGTKRGPSGPGGRTINRLAARHSRRRRRASEYR